MVTFALKEAPQHQPPTMQVFTSIQEAANAIEHIPQDPAIYQILHSAIGGGYILAKYLNGQLLGYLEKEDA
jgi:hypothetical protein